MVTALIPQTSDLFIAISKSTTRTSSCALDRELLLHARHAFGAIDVLRRRIAPYLALARVVDQELGNLARRAAFLAIVDHHADVIGASSSLDGQWIADQRRAI